MVINPPPRSPLPRRKAACKIRTWARGAMFPCPVAPLPRTPSLALLLLRWLAHCRARLDWLTRFQRKTMDPPESGVALPWVLSVTRIPWPIKPPCWTLVLRRLLALPAPLWPTLRPTSTPPPRASRPPSLLLPPRALFPPMKSSGCLRLLSSPALLPAPLATRPVPLPAPPHAPSVAYPTLPPPVPMSTTTSMWIAPPVCRAPKYQISAHC